jgi:hypothetical protein
MAVFVIGRSLRRPLWRSGLRPATSVAGTGSGTSASRERMDGVMPQFEGAFEPETVKLLRGVLDEAWDALTPEQQTQTCKSDMALRILQLAQRGELDPSRLRMAAMLRTNRRNVHRHHLLGGAQKIHERAGSRCSVPSLRCRAND